MIGNWRQRLQNNISQGSYGGNATLKWWPYFDVVALLNATTNYTLFSTPKGGAKTLSDTNWRNANQIPASEYFEAHAVFMYYHPSAAKTQTEEQHIKDAFRNGVLTFNLNGKANNFELPLWMLAGSPMPLTVTGGAVGDQAYGQSLYSGFFPLEVEIPIANKATLDFQLNFKAAVNASMEGDELFIGFLGPRVNEN